LVVTSLLAAGCAAQGLPNGDRPAAWAMPIATQPGLQNVYKVNDRLYRGAQPTAAGMTQLQDLGIRTVLSLRSSHDDGEELRGTTLTGERIVCHSAILDDDNVDRFLQIVTDPARQPVFVHCQHGSDRTGVMIAAYRVAVDGWTPGEAAREMVEGGYGFHRVWFHLVDEVREFDGPALRRRAGLSELPAAHAASNPGPAS
jgi:protein tyrosine/serine phosphatase